MATCQKCVEGMYEQQFSNSLTVPHILWSELDSWGTTGIGNQDQVTKTSCSTWCYSSWFLYNLCELEPDKISYRDWYKVELISGKFCIKLSKTRWVV